MQRTFKTPQAPSRTPRTYREKYSDSDESVTSNSSNGDISLVAEFDDLMSYFRSRRAREAETLDAFIDLAEKSKTWFEEYFQAKDECRRLQSCLDAKIHECGDLEHKLLQARRFLDLESQNTRAVKKERDELASQLELVRELLSKDKPSTKNIFSEDEFKKLSFLHDNFSDITNGQQPALSVIKEINSTGSILSDFSYSRSEDDLDDHLTFLQKENKVWKTHRPSMDGIAEPASKKRRSSGDKKSLGNKNVEIGASDTVRATTTLVVSKDGPVTATSVIESIPQNPSVIASGDTEPKTPARGLPNGDHGFLPRILVENWQNDSPRSGRRLIERQHVFLDKIMMVPDTCAFCEKRIRFAKVAAKCKDCKALCHMECKGSLPLPCIPAVDTPKQRNCMGVIGDFTPTIPPMVPAILVHCINEIELRGLTEIGLYRIPGSERDVKQLKEKFLKGRGSPCLNGVDVSVLCGTVKNFLKTLYEPLITYALWPKFVEAVEDRNTDVQVALMKVISELPQPNRDTLAYMMLHLQKVAQSVDCKMNASNLSKVFGPTIVGYSSRSVSPTTLLPETLKNNMVMEALIHIPSDYWSTFVDIEGNTLPSKLQQTPSTDSLLRGIPTKRSCTPSSNRNFSVKRNKNINYKQKYFPSPERRY